MSLYKSIVYNKKKIFMWNIETFALLFEFYFATW